MHAEFPGKVAISMHEIVEGVVRDRDLVAKLRIQNFFPGMFVGDSRKFMLVKISHYTVHVYMWSNPMADG